MPPPQQQHHYFINNHIIQQQQLEKFNAPMLLRHAVDDD
jgi:hypothetical protein